MPQSSLITTATGQTEQSLAFEKMLASDIIAQWPDDRPFDASVILADHPELRQHKSVVLDLAYEEYCRRTDQGEKLSAHDFASRFRDVQRSLLCLIDVHQLLHDNPQLMADATEPSWPKVGESFQDLELTANLGRGAFARVFLARESGIGRRLVVSKLSKTGGREADFLGQLEHPQIVPIFSVKHDEQSGLSAICMPYLGRTTLLDLIDGITARESIPTSGAQLREIIQSFELTPETPAKRLKPVRIAWQRTSLDALIDLGIQLSEGLEFAHEQNICHGDIKPSNVLITPQGQALLMDFNLSFQTQGDDKALGGTLPYMAPEQLQRIVRREAGQVPASNEQTDIYALGVVMYELLAGRYPFGSIPVDEPKQQAAHKLLGCQQNGFRPLRELNPNIDRQLAECIEKCLAYDVAQRWQTATELRKALEYAGSLRRRSWRWLGRHRKTVLAAVVAASLAVSAGAYAWGTRDVRMFRAAKEALIAQDYDVAIELLNEVLEISPELDEAHFLLGRAYQGAGENEDAYEQFNIYKQDHPDDRRNIACISQCLAVRGLGDDVSHDQRISDLTGAIENYREAFGDPRVSEVALNNNIGYCHLALHEYNSAEEYLTTALASAPNQSVTHHHMIVLNRQRALNAPELFDRQVLEDAMMLADGIPETFLEAARSYAALLRELKDENERSIAMKRCLECSRQAVDCGLLPESLKKVVNELKMFRQIAQFSAEFEEIEKLQNRPLPVKPAEKFNPLIDPSLETPAGSNLVRPPADRRSIASLIGE